MCFLEKKKSSVVLVFGDVGESVFTEFEKDEGDFIYSEINVLRVRKIVMRMKYE